MIEQGSRAGDGFGLDETKSPLRQNAGLLMNDFQANDSATDAAADDAA